MALVGLVPLAVAAGITQYVVANAHRDDVAKLESAVITEKGGEIQNFLDQNLLTQAKVVVPVGPGIDVSTSAQKFVLGETLRILPFVQSESFIDFRGKETARVDRAHMSGYDAKDLRDVSGAPEFQAARTGDYYLGPVSYDLSGPSVVFASPVKNDAGQTIAVVAGDASLDPLESILQNTTIGAEGYIYLVDPAGKVVAGGGKFKDETGTSSVGALPIVQQALAGQDALTPETQMRYKNVFGESVVAAAAAMPEHGSAWAIVAEWPTDEADAIINTLLFRDVIALFGVLIAVILISIFAALFFTHPIQKLRAGTERVAKGKFDEGVSIRTGDELEELGDSFNDMMIGLKELEQLKDEFVFIAAHELKTPVAAIKGYLSLILDGTTGALNDTAREYLEKVIASNQRLIQLVNDLLEVARSQAGRLTIKVAPIAITPSIRAVIDELKSLADAQSVTVAYDPPADLPNVLADTDRVKEVMVNLIGNAIKYMGGAGTITVSHEIDPQNKMLVTHVTDTGLGMSQEEQEKLFQKFYRVQNEKTRDIAGTGLGLFIVKEIIEKMSGTIWAVSEPGKGSTFSFTLPLES